MTWTRRVLVALGVALIGVGAAVGLTSIPQRQWPGIVIWLAGGVAVHDAVLAPAAVLLGLVVLPRVDPRWRPALRAGALGAAVLALFAVVIVGASAHRRNDSVVPVPPTTSLVVAAAVLAVCMLLGATLGAVAQARHAPADPGLFPRETE